MRPLYRPYTVLPCNYKVDTAKAPRNKTGRYTVPATIPSRKPSPHPTRLMAAFTTRGRSRIGLHPHSQTALKGRVAGCGRSISEEPTGGR